jgi:hypothetical protein
MPTKRFTAPIIACLLLMLPAIYVGSYFAAVEPFGRRFEASRSDPVFINDMLAGKLRTGDYRYGGRAAATVYWPLEQIDRWVRPDYWQRPQMIQVQTIGDLEIVTGLGSTIESLDSPGSTTTGPMPTVDDSLENLGKMPFKKREPSTVPPRKLSKTEMELLEKLQGQGKRTIPLPPSIAPPP